ncbi:MAG: LysE family transporter [Chloroflexi bacterium]|nr:LysE family transporter [Chloroflexota bacterium]
MDAFWEGVLAGYGIAIPVGAIAILIVNAGMRHGFHEGFLAGAGAASADLLFAALAALGGPALAVLLQPLAGGLRWVSAAVLIGLGAYGLWRLRQSRTQLPAAVTLRGGWRTYAQFLGLTLLNPLTVAYFAALIIGRGSGMAFDAHDRLLFVVGAGLASLSWQMLLALLGALAHRHLSPRVQVLTSVIGNLVVVALGLRILWVG